MPSVPQTIRFRHTRRIRQGRSPWGRLGLSFSMLLSLLIIGSLLIAATTYASLVRNLPSLDELPALLEPPDGKFLQPTRLYDRTGEHLLLALDNPAAHDRRYLHVAGENSTLSESDAIFSPAVISATIAVVDPTFWHNPGYSTQDIGEGSHPTLAQRLVFDLLLSEEEPSLSRDVRERLLAAQMIARFGRTQVLEWYLNSARYGDFIYGADAAALVFFGKSASELNIAEAAVLAAVMEAPGINPLEAYQVVMPRQQQVIAQMLVQGLVTAEQAGLALRQEVIFRELLQPDNPAPAFTNLALEQLATQFSLPLLERGGFRIITTLDYDLQLQAACTTQTQVARLQGESAEFATRDGEECVAAQLLPTLLVEAGSSALQPIAQAVVLDPHTGQVLAMVGQALPSLDPSHPPGQAAGTILTPFIYLTAFARGFSPGSLVWDIPPSPAPMEGSMSPQMQDNTEYHGPMRLRTALANDYPGPAAQLLLQVGADNFWRTARGCGFRSLEPLSTEMGLDAWLESEITLLEGVQAYGVLSNQGLLAGRIFATGSSLHGGEISPELPALEALAVLRLEDSAGSVLLDWSQPQVRPIISPQLAYLVTDVLSDEPARWRSLGHPNPLEIGRPAGASLGRLPSGQAGWSVGYIPQMALGVWVGYPVMEADHATSSYPPQQAAAGLWHAILQYASRQLPVEQWEIPPGVSLVDVCDPSGLLPTEQCPAVVQEAFLAGNEPVQSDNLYQAFLINRETDRLATVFTPPELVEQRIYLVAPPQVEAWARAAGLAIPPDIYDDISVQPNASPDVQLSQPAMFAHVHGQVSLYGSAAGDGFAYYRLQVGQGLYPTQWLQIGEDATTPVENGLLGVWDTQELSGLLPSEFSTTGLFVVQLLVVREDQTIERAVLQITVDNQLPSVTILDPAEGQQLAYEAGGMILLQASASDNLVLERVEFYVDDVLVSTLSQPPYAVLLPSRLGMHTLLVRVYDRAGNLSETAVTFTVQ